MKDFVRIEILGVSIMSLDRSDAQDLYSEIRDVVDMLEGADIGDYPLLDDLRKALHKNLYYPEEE